MNTQTEQKTETWEESRKREELERAKKHKSAIALIGKVAKCLGMHIVKSPHTNDVPHFTGVTITDNERFLFIRANGYQLNGRMEVHGSYPRYADGSYCQPCGYNEANPKISLSLSKTPEQIAKAIKARLYPAYEPLLTKANEMIRSNSNYKEKTKNTKEELGIFPNTADESTAYLYERGEEIKESNSCEVKVNGSTISLDVRTSDIKAVKELLKALGLLPGKAVR